MLVGSSARVGSVHSARQPSGLRRERGGRPRRAIGTSIGEGRACSGGRNVLSRPRDKASHTLTMVLQEYLSRSIPCPQSGYSVRYILATLGETCSFHTRPSHSQRADHPHRATGRELERSDVAERRIRTLQGAIGLRRARVPPYSMLIWRPLPSAEAANPLPSDVSGLPPHTYCILTLLSCASFASPHVAGMSAECVPSVFKHLQLTLALHCTRHAIRAHLVRADASRLPLR